MPSEPSLKEWREDLERSSLNPASVAYNIWRSACDGDRILGPS